MMMLATPRKAPDSPKTAPVRTRSGEQSYPLTASDVVSAMARSVERIQAGA